MMHHDADVPTTSPLMDRRNFLVAATTSLLCAPAIVRGIKPDADQGDGLDTACVARK
jgi:hypothetical protein